MSLTAFKLACVGATEHAPTLNSSSIAPQIHKRNVTMHVNGKVAGIACTWLLDTGADVTCVSANLPGIQALPLSPATSTPSAANSASLDCVGEIRTTIKIGHVTRHSVRVLVIRNLNSPAILGLDVLQEYEHMSVDWRSQTLELGGHKIMLERRTLGIPKQPTEVRLIVDQVIPARSQCFITAASTDFGQVAQDNLFTPDQEKMVKCNVLLGSGVVKQEPRNQIPVVVMNNSEKPVKLYCGTMIGHLSSVQVEEKATASSKPTPKRRDPVNVDLTDSCLEQKQKETIKKMLEDYRDIFANDDSEVGKTSRVQFKINTGDNPPVAVKLRRTPFALRAEVDRQIREMEDKGVIRRSSSPWSSPILLVPKKDGSYRFCADFRALNDVTKTEIFPLPSIRECLDSLGGSAMFSTLDLYSGYWQIKMDPEDQQKTAFTTEAGHWEFLVMPFGVKNAPAVFSRLMADVMRGLTWNGVAIYLDDVIVGGRNFEEHSKLLREVFQRLREAGLTIKSSKVHLCQKELRFLGHVVSVDGIAPDPEKVEAILKWPRPNTVKDVRSFLGLCNYYMEFIPDMQLLAKPLNQLTGKAKFQWTETQEEAFNKLKNALANTSILAFPDMNKPFELSTDASDTGFGCILSQHDDAGQERPVYFTSKTFGDNELSWHTRDKEAFALVYGLRKFRHYLLGRKFTWYTDHLGLKWLRSTRDPRGRYARWIEEIEEFQFDICHRPGTKNQHADALSRRPIEQTVQVVVTDGKVSAEEMREKQKQDPILKQVITCLRLRRESQPNNPKVRAWMTKRKDLFLDKHTGLLHITYRIGKHSCKQLVVPESLVPEVLHMKHDEAGHMATVKTRKLVQREYYWLSMYEDTAKYCESCPVCATSRAPQNSKAELTFTSQPTEPWQQISMDMKGPFGPNATARGNRYILVVLDLLTRYAEMIPVPNKLAKTVADALVTHVFCRHGIPESILTDRGLEFDNSAMQTLADELGIDKKRISPRHPQANGAVERLNRTMGEMLKKMENDNDQNWDLNIPFVRFNYQNQEHSATGFSPFFLTYGRHPRTPALVIQKQPSKPITVHKWASDLARNLKEAHQEGVTKDIAEKKRRVSKSSKSSNVTRYKAGDKVWIYAPPKPGRSSSLQKRWQGPYIITHCLEGYTYRLKKMGNFRKRLLLHHNQLQPVKDRPDRLEYKASNRNQANEQHSTSEVDRESLPVRGQQQQHNSMDYSLPIAEESEEEHEQDTSLDAEHHHDGEERDEPQQDNQNEQRVHQGMENQDEEEQEQPHQAVGDVGVRRSERRTQKPQRFGEWEYDADVTEGIRLLYSDVVKGLNNSKNIVS